MTFKSVRHLAGFTIKPLLGVITAQTGPADAQRQPSTPMKDQG